MCPCFWSIHWLHGMAILWGRTLAARCVRKLRWATWGKASQDEHSKSWSQQLCGDSLILPTVNHNHLLKKTMSSCCLNLMFDVLMKPRCITQQLRRLWGVSMPCTCWQRQWWRHQPRRQRSSKAIFRSKKISWTFISIASIAFKIKMFRIFINLQSWRVYVRLVFFHHHVSVSLSYTVQCYNILQAKKIFRKGARDARKLGLTKQALAFMQDLGHLAELRLWSHDVTKFLVVTWWSLENTLLLVPGKWFSNFPLWSLWHTLTNILQPPILIHSRLEAFCCRARVNCWKRRNSSNECYEVRDGSLSGVKGKCR